MLWTWFMYLTSSTPAKPRAPRSCRTWQASLAMPPTRTKAHAYLPVLRALPGQQEAPPLAQPPIRPRSRGFRLPSQPCAAANNCRRPSWCQAPSTRTAAKPLSLCRSSVASRPRHPTSAEVGITSAAFPCIPTATAAFRPRWNAPLAASSSTAPPVAHANPPYTDPSPNPSTPPLVATARLLNTRWWWLPCFPASPTAAGCSWGCST